MNRVPGLQFEEESPLLYAEAVIMKTREFTCSDSVVQGRVYLGRRKANHFSQLHET